jgi:hypothetical protein
MEDVKSKQRNNAGSYLPSADIVKLALVKHGHSDEQIDTILGLLNYGRTEKLVHVTTLAKRLNVHPTTVSRLFAGTYGMSKVDGELKRTSTLDSIISKIEHFLDLNAKRKAFGETPICRDLLVVQDITDFCELTRATATMSVLYGPNQSGKSWALEKIYTPANNHGRTVYVSMLQSGGTTRLFLEDLLKACGISERKSYGDMKRRLYKYFDPQTLLIVDEYHQTLVGRTIKMTSIELIRAIYDKCGCGIVLCGTDIVPDMFEDPRFKKFLGQTSNRGALRRLIPATPYPEDVVTLCRAYGFGAPTGEAKKFVDEIATTNGIGKLCRFLQMSRRLANKQKSEPTWDHFLATRATLNSWAKGERMKREKR